MKRGDKSSTVRVLESTKQKLVNLDFAKKDMSFDSIISELVSRYNKRG